jgi:hypothetical protein
MNARLEMEYHFNCVVHHADNPPIINTFRAIVNFVTNTTDHNEQNIAFDRINYFVGNIFDNSVLIHESDESNIKKYQNCGFRVIPLPVIPVDQIVGICLFEKMNAIAEDRLILTDITISSDVSAGLKCHYCSEEKNGIFSSTGWWNLPDLSYANKRSNKKQKILEFNADHSWKSVDLDWKTTEEVEENIVLINIRDK